MFHLFSFLQYFPMYILFDFSLISINNNVLNRFGLN